MKKKMALVMIVLVALTMLSGCDLLLNLFSSDPIVGVWELRQVNSYSLPATVNTDSGSYVVNWETFTFDWKNWEDDFNGSNTSYTEEGTWYKDSDYYVLENDNGIWCHLSLSGSEDMLTWVDNSGNYFYYYKD